MNFFVVFILWTLFPSTKSSISQSKDEQHRQLVYNTDRSHQCYDVTINNGYADYLQDPFKASNTRGDWGIILIYQLFLFDR